MSEREEIEAGVAEAEDDRWDESGAFDACDGCDFCDPSLERWSQYLRDAERYPPEPLTATIEEHTS